MKKFNNVPLGKLLLNAFEWFDESLLASLKEQGWPEVSRSQSMVMAYLKDDGIRISELARRIGVSRQAAQKTVQELEKARLVKTAIDPSNSSAKIVVLTAEGKAIVAAAVKTFTEIEWQLAKRIGKENAHQLRVVLEMDWGKSFVVNTRSK